MPYIYMATGTIPNNLAADVNALKSNKADFVTVTSSGGHTSTAAITELRRVVDNLSGSSVYFGRMVAGDFGLILIVKGGANYIAVFYFSYTTTTTKKSIIKSMTKSGGTWDDWVTISS